jgi:ribonuclease-3
MQPLSSNDSLEASPAGILEEGRIKELLEFERHINIHFRRIELLDQALSHSSFVNELPDQRYPHNEKLEFLGDAVLELVISHELFDNYPAYYEGELTKLRAAVVRRTTLAKVAKTIGIAPYIRLGKGEELGGGRRRNSLLADAIEAVIGAIFLDSGLDAARSFISEHFNDEIKRLDRDRHKMDYKSILQEITQSRFQTLPKYTTLSESGPPHDRRYRVQLSIENKPYGTGIGRNKKEAQQNAARQALQQLQT